MGGKVMIIPVKNAKKQAASVPLLNRVNNDSFNY
jgi:hypothetical protein